MANDLEGQYDDAFIELLVVKLNVGGVKESIIKKHKLHETLITL